MTYSFSKFKDGLKEKEKWFRHECSQIRTGRANLSVLDSVTVEAYGAKMPLEGVASMNIEDSRTIRITPWDKNNSKAIEKVILTASLGLSVSVDEKGIRVIFPELTADRRQMLVKLVKDKLEQTRIGVRKLRDDAIKDIDTKEKQGGMGEDEKFRLKQEVQKIVGDINKSLDGLLEKKEKEILQ